MRLLRISVGHQYDRSKILLTFSRPEASQEAIQSIGYLTTCDRKVQGLDLNSYLQKLG